MQWCCCRDCHISCQVRFFLSGNLNKGYLQLLLVPTRRLDDHSGVYIRHELMDVLGNLQLAMVRQDMQDVLHRCQLCVEISGGYVENTGVNPGGGGVGYTSPSPLLREGGWPVRIYPPLFKEK